jgi:hypothetical protein
MEIVKNIIGDDCWGIIVDYLVGDKQYNNINRILNDNAHSLKMTLNNAIVQMRYPITYNFHFYYSYNAVNEYCYICHKKLHKIYLATTNIDKSIDFTMKLCDKCISDSFLRINSKLRYALVHTKLEKDITRIIIK